MLDTGETRLDKILRVVGECRNGIHDISRVEQSDGLPCFNMPFELGLYLGCKRFGSARDRQKRCLVLDTDRYRYQRFLSDIAGQDIAEHGGDPERAAGRVRDWLRSSSGRTRIPGGSIIWRRFRRFGDDLPELCAEVPIDPDELTFADRSVLVSQWLLTNAPA